MRVFGRWRRLLPALGVVLWLVVGGALGPYAGKLGDVSTNDQASFLPESAESTRVNELREDFDRDRTAPAIVVWVADGGRPVTARQKADAARSLAEAARTPGVTGKASPVIPSRDGRALEAVLPLKADLGYAMGDAVGAIRTAVGGIDGLRAQVAGPAAAQADLMNAFAGIDGVLLAVALAVVLLILLVVYRSVLLPLIVIVTAVFALALACAVIYALARADVLHVDGQVQGLLFILVIGAGTDYALLLTARFREELTAGREKSEAMLVAWRRSAGAVTASAATVALALLVLLLSGLRNNQAMGPAGAIGVVCAMVASLTFLPAVLTLLGRGAYWPVRPEIPDTGSTGVPGAAGEGTAGGTAGRGTAGQGMGGQGGTAGTPAVAGAEDPRGQRALWRRIAALVDRHPRRLWAGTLLGLAACAAFSPLLAAHGVPLDETFVNDAPSLAGQRMLAEHFVAGSGNPAVIVARADHAEQVAAAARRTDGVAQAALLTTGPLPGRGAPVVAHGRARIDVTLTDAADSDAAKATVPRLRAAVHAVRGAGALVGGYTAEQYDTQATAARDRTLLIPAVLLIIFLVLVVLLRGLLLSLLLVATVALNYLAAIGVTALVFRYGLGFGGTDASVPLYGFVFLVALGVDYNIFLMTRVREEAVRRGTRAGVLGGLAATGGVITSAGVVLAATFAALVVIPVAFMAQMAFIVAFGVLLDTVVVRSLLVPALVRDIGAPVWWPGRVTEPAPVPAPPGPPDETARTRATEAA